MSRLLLIRWRCLSKKWRLHQPEFRNEGKVVVNFCRITFRCGVSRTAIRSSGLNIFREISIFLPLSVDCRKKKRWNSIGNAPNRGGWEDKQVNEYSLFPAADENGRRRNSGDQLRCSSHANCCDSLSESLNDGHPSKGTCHQRAWTPFFFHSKSMAGLKRLQSDGWINSWPGDFKLKNNRPAINVRWHMDRSTITCHCPATLLWGLKRRRKWRRG